MNCIDFEVAMEKAVETRTPLTANALEHSRQCQSCRIVLESHLRLETAISAWRSVEPPAGLLDAVMAELARPEVTEDVFVRTTSFEPQLARNEFPTNGRKRSNLESRLAVASLASCLFAAFLFMVQMSGKSSSELASNVPDQDAKTVVADAPVDVSSALTAVLADLRSEYREMASETKLVAREMVNAIPHPIAVSVLPDVDESALLPDSGDLDRIWHPIGSRVESALSFLWQVVPGDGPAS